MNKNTWVMVINRETETIEAYGRYADVKYYGETEYYFKEIK